MKLSKKKTIVIFITIVATILISASIFIIFSNHTIATAENEPTVQDNSVPDVTPENTTFEIAEESPENEEIIEKIKITISSKLENYNLYYWYKPLEVEDNEIEENYILCGNEIEIEENANLYFKYELTGNYSQNPYTLEINTINKEKIVEEAPENEGATEEQLQKEKVTKISNTAPYYIVVNYSSNVVTIYGKDENNEYTRPIKAMICSTGIATPRSGIYKLGARSKWRALFGNVYGQYAVNIVGNILFHSVPYLSTDNSTLEYWEYDKLGTSASAGCIRLKVEDALWIFNNCGRGTQVEFSASAPTPLGKPGAKKISGYPDLRGFDPTDPASNNPWRNANVSQNNNPSNTPSPTEPVETKPEIKPEVKPDPTPQPNPDPKPDPSPDPTPDPTPDPDPEPEPTPDPIPQPTPDPSAHLPKID